MQSRFEEIEAQKVHIPLSECGLTAEVVQAFRTR
jgi:hypothetical protein